ncbi:antitoxin VbhA family protein [Variovorax sp. ZT5P49]|uniref:antitoxin VbhA family protein n=1 Tax=Variovorax sp. ZT5P49 TaxID=3443733 RepID=UPI003F48EAE2
MSTKAQRQYAMQQALANTQLAGHEPKAEFLSDCEAVVAGQITHEEALVASVARARRLDSMLEKFDPELHGGEVMRTFPVGKEVF